MPLAEWMVEQQSVNRFVQRAHERNPPAWDIGEGPEPLHTRCSRPGALRVRCLPCSEHRLSRRRASWCGCLSAASRLSLGCLSAGEDTVLGMWVHQSPFPITALHWGWDKIHDLCFQCKDKTKLWKPITTSSVRRTRATRAHAPCPPPADRPPADRDSTSSAPLKPPRRVRCAAQVIIHIKGHQASWFNFDAVHRNFSQRCDDACQQEVLPLDVTSLADLCGRNAAIQRSYSKCKTLK